MSRDSTWTCIAVAIIVMSRQVEKVVIALPENVEIEHGFEGHAIADLLLIVDMSNSVTGYEQQMKNSLKELIANFKVSEDNIRVALIECNRAIKPGNEEEVVKLKFEEGTSFDIVREKLEKLSSKSGNPFITCFNAAIKIIFGQSNGDRPEAQNVIAFLSDLNWENEQKHYQEFEPIEQLQKLKKQNTAIISIAYCDDYETCREKNEKVASKPQYALAMEDFNANNKAIQDALRHSTSCRQKVELMDCSWTSNRKCQRKILISQQYSSSICQKLADKSKLWPEDALKNDIKCASVNKISVETMCYLKEKNCVTKGFTITSRAASRLDKYREPGAIERDQASCNKTKPKDEKCPSKLCKFIDCNQVTIANCENIVSLKNCQKELQTKCKGAEDIDKRCYPFYYAKNNSNFVAGFTVVDWEAELVKTQFNTVKALCEDNALRLNCSRWLTKTFQTTHFDICKKAGASISVDCIKNFDPEVCSPEKKQSMDIEELCGVICDEHESSYMQCIEDKINTYKNNYPDEYPCKNQTAALKKYEHQHNHDLNPTPPPDNDSPQAKQTGSDSDKGGNSKGVLIGVIVAILLLVILSVVLALFLVKRRRQKRKQKHLGIPSKKVVDKSAAFQADLNSTTSRAATLKSVGASQTSKSSYMSKASSKSKASKTYKSSKRSKAAKTSKASKLQVPSSKSKKSANKFAGIKGKSVTANKLGSKK